ncbi:PorP/SprF family type IX secretion system membrane protein [Ferruginibacter sp. SUN106]|uniref:PorP/SprF family type IX secretion system membrane protein n=1 Tax=Ferruginibacter sp. SUN106 TaxID=2978348 RepID=UPI003D369264
MKHKILTALFVAFVATTNAQQLQTSSMYDMQGVLHNPSTAGVYENNFVGVSYRSQWAGISGSPKTATVFGSFNLPKQAIGIGGYVYQDKTGPTSRTGIDLSLAKHIVMGDKGVFSLGLETRLQQYALNTSKLYATLGNDPVLGGADSRFKYDAGFGVSYTSKTIEVGASVSQLVQSKLNFYSGNLTRTEEAMLYRHYYAHAAYHIDVDGYTTITPNAILVYLPNAPVNYQVGARFEHNKIFWWGLGYRSHQSFMISAGININKKFTVGYAYDDYINPVSSFDNGANAHEVLIRYNFIK